MKEIILKLLDIDLRKALRPIIVLGAAGALTYMACGEFMASKVVPTWYLTLAGSLLSWMFAEKALTKGVMDDDGKPLTKSKRFFLVVAGPSKMSGQKFNQTRGALCVLGGLPVLLQVMQGALIFKNTTKGKLKIIPLSPAGLMGEPLALTSSDKGKVFDLSKGRTFVYEVRTEK